MFAIKTGCDIVYLPRFRKTIGENRKVIERIFTKQELSDDSIEHLAGIFAAKEAVMKTLGIKAGEWHKIEIGRNKDGKPEVVLKHIPLPEQISISISHDGEYAMAVVVAIVK